jgi:hypothetical protein
VVLAALAAAPAFSAPGDIVCWTDERGVRSCGDHVPPQYASKQRDIYNQRGMMVETLKAEQTPEQRAEAQRLQLEADAAAQQRQNDAFLLQTFSSVDQLRELRDSRLQSFDVRIQIAQKSVRDGAATLKDLEDRADVDRAAGRDADPKLMAQIKTFENAQADNIRALARIQQDREDEAQQYEHKIQHYMELRPSAPASPAASPAARP